MIASSLLLLSLQDPVFGAPELLLGKSSYIACHDLDLDGDQDLLVEEGNPPNSVIRSLLNDGSGKFVPGSVIAASGAGSNGAYQVQFGDLSGDGQQDLVLRRAGSAQDPNQFLDVYLGNGLGGFQSPLSVPTSSLRKNYTLAQLDTDPELELVVAVPNALQVFEYLGSALVLTKSFNVPGVDQPANLPGGGALQAFDSDGDGLDTLFASIAAGPQLPNAKVPVLIDLPSSGFASLTPLSPALQTQSYTEYHRVGTIGDVDGDGDPDLVIVSTSNPNVSVNVWTNDGAGGFAAYSQFLLPFVPYGTVGSAAGQASMLMGDWDLDGSVDLLGERRAGWGFLETPLLMRISGSSPGAFDQIDYLPSTSALPIVALTDLGGDGRPDLVSRSSILKGGTDFWPLQAQVPPVRLFSDPEIRPTLDLDGDGDFDYRSDLYHKPGLAIHGANDGAAQWAPSPWKLSGADPAEFNALSGLTQDLDNDGLVEHLVFRTGLGGSPIPELWRCELLPGVGFVPVAAVTANPFDPAQVRFFGLADFDGDGRADLIVGPSVFQGQSNGSFSDNPLFFVPGAEFLGAGDIDADGDADLIGRLGNDLWSIRPGPGAPVYQKLTSGAPVSVPLLADLDLDGDLDLAVAWQDPLGFPAVLRCFQNQSGVFVQRPDSSSFSVNWLRDLTATDLDGDGRLDLAAVQSSNAFASAFVWLGSGLPIQFPAARVYAIWPSLGLADLDQDGDLDLVSDRPIQGARFDGGSAGKIQQYGSPVAGTGGATPLLGASGPLRSNSTTAAIHGTGGLGGAGAVLVFGTARGTAPGVPLPGLDLLVAGNLFLYPLTLDGPSGVAGAGGFTLPVLNPQNFVGKTFTHQLFVIDPASPTVLTQSNGLELHYGL